MNYSVWVSPGSAPRITAPRGPGGAALAIASEGVLERSRGRRIRYVQRAADKADCVTTPVAAAVRRGMPGLSRDVI